MQLRLNALRACGRKSVTTQSSSSERSNLSFKIQCNAGDSKRIFSQDCNQDYQLQKLPNLQKYHNYTWKLLGASKNTQHSNELLAVTCDSIKGEVTLTKADGSLLTTIYIRHQSFFTVVKFKWQNSSYRWIMSRHAASRSMSNVLRPDKTSAVSHLHVTVTLEGGSNIIPTILSCFESELLMLKGISIVICTQCYKIRLFDRFQRPNQRTKIAPSVLQASPPSLQLSSVRTSSLCKHITSQYTLEPDVHSGEVLVGQQVLQVDDVMDDCG
ncbi:hypothetical protein WJX79_010987 [Trebouxia sp. C0005]